MVKVPPPGGAVSARDRGRSGKAEPRSRLLRRPCSPSKAASLASMATSRIRITSRLSIGISLRCTGQPKNRPWRQGCTEGQLHLVLQSSGLAKLFAVLAAVCPFGRAVKSQVDEGQPDPVVARLGLLGAAAATVDHRGD